MAERTVGAVRSLPADSWGDVGSQAVAATRRNPDVVGEPRQDVPITNALLPDGHALKLIACATEHAPAVLRPYPQTEPAPEETRNGR